MGIPELLRGVLNERGYGGIEEMAVRESMRIGEVILPGTLRTWMTTNDRYRRVPRDIRSLRTIQKITDRSLDELTEIVESDARDNSARKTLATSPAPA